jgi:pimeloyl-ACP methyl ester carboxylesterase
MNVEDLKVPGATLHVFSQGSGPTLLLIPGAPADSYFFAGVGAVLAEKYTVVTMELRGLSRSPLDGEPADLTPADFAADAATVLDKYADGPAFVLGASGGAIAGLELVARYPGKVSTLVAHEPPAAAVLPNGDAWIAFFDEIHETGKTMGSGAAFGRFIASFDGYDGPEKDESKGEPPAFPMPDFSQLSPEEMEGFQRMGTNTDVFVNHIIRDTPRYVPDYEALKGSDTKIVIGVGEASGGQLPHKAGQKIADNLGIEATVFPGDHQGFGTHTQEWAAAVDRALSS